MTALFLRGHTTLYNQNRVSEVVEGAGEVVTPSFSDDRCQTFRHHLAATALSIGTAPSPQPRQSEEADQSRHSLIVNDPLLVCGHSAAVGASDEIGSTMHNSSHPVMMRTISSFDYSTQCVPPASPANRRVIFPTLHHQTSWPVASCTEQGLKQQRRSDTNIPWRSLWGPGCTITVKGSAGEIGMGGDVACSLPGGTRELASDACDHQIDGPMVAGESFTSKQGSQHQHLILPPSPPMSTCRDQGVPDVVGSPLPSILRRPKHLNTNKNKVRYALSVHSKTTAVDKIPSVESDIPSLASTLSLSSFEECAQETPVRETTTNPPPMPRPSHAMNTRSVSAPVTTSDHKKISFDPRVWVREFQRCPSEEKVTWYSNRDLEGFKEEAIKLIMACAETELVPTGTGRFVPRKVVPKTKAFFSHRALRLDAVEDNESNQKDLAKKIAQQREIRRILIVDCHDICLKLFTKGFKNILPHVEVVGAVSWDDALKKSCGQSFDVILVEERLKLFRHEADRNLSSNTRNGTELASGAALIRALKDNLEGALFIGVSTRLQEDAAKLKAGGADICWSKPPPKLDDFVADEILRALLLRRCQQGTVRELFANT